ncbi:MAG: recombination mediator RecR [Coriobacteriales bacterium]|nr:recombination mediator RecR [Coriobacteriales bacterium]
MAQIEYIDKMLEELQKLPGIGPKSAQRILHFLLTNPSYNPNDLIKAISDIKSHIKMCENCHNYSTSTICEICADDKRNKKIVCVVSEPKDIESIEKTGSYDGIYHVLGGNINPIDAVYPKDLHIDDLVERVKTENFDEVLIATDPNLEGDNTALYIYNLIQNFDCEVTRIASGLPVGGELEFADEVTLSRSLTNRTKLSAT